MAEYIERAALIEAFYKDAERCGDPEIPWDLSAIETEIEDAPAADVAPVVHGRWETDREDIEWGNHLKRKHCTNCGKRPHFDKEKREFILSDYCPNCGAKMEDKA